MKWIKYKGRLYLVSAPRLHNGGPRYACDAWTTKIERDAHGLKRSRPNNEVKGEFLLNDLARKFMDGYGIKGGVSN